MPAPITAQVATVRHSTSVPANFQMASRQETTATTMHALVVQKETLVTTRGLRNPRLVWRRFAFGVWVSSGMSNPPYIIAVGPARLLDLRARDQAQFPQESAKAGV